MYMWSLIRINCKLENVFYSITNKIMRKTVVYYLLLQSKERKTHINKLVVLSEYSTRYCAGGAIWRFNTSNKKPLVFATPQTSLVC